MEIARIKTLLGVAADDHTQDAAMEFVAEDVAETICNYCNLQEIPPGLDNTAYRMAIDLYRYDRPGDAGAPMAVSSMSEGDTSTSFTSASEALKNGILSDYKGQLNRYRRLIW